MTRTILVIGSGSIGSRHLRNLRALRAGRLLAADIDRASRERAAKENGAEPVKSLEAGLRRHPDAVLVCTPPVNHAAAALAALEAGADVFVEKPLAHRLADGQRLVRAARRAGRELRVGYNLRHEKGLRRLHGLLGKESLGMPVSALAEFGQYLPDWRPAQDYRRSYTARHALGGGILLDGSHEIDTLRWLLGEPTHVLCRARQVPHLQADVEGIADVLLRFPRNLTAALHLDFVQHGYERRMKVVGTARTALWDFGKRVLTLQGAGGGRPSVWTLPADANQMYLDEMRAFLGLLRGRPTILPDVADALQTLRVSLAAHRAAATGKEVRV